MMTPNAKSIGVIADAIARSSRRDRDAFLAEQLDIPADDPILRRLRLFSGLILRIKHSFVWERAPLTMGSLVRTGTSLAVFAAYSERLDLASLPSLSPTARTERFLKFLAKDENGLPPDAAGVSGIARHELNVWKTSLAAHSQFEDVSLKDISQIDARAALTLASTARVNGYTGDPRSGAGCSVGPINTARVVLVYTSRGSIELKSRHEKELFTCVLEGLELTEYLRAGPAEPDRVETLVRFCNAGVIRLERIYS